MTLSICVALCYAAGTVLSACPSRSTFQAPVAAEIARSSSQCSCHAVCYRGISPIEHFCKQIFWIGLDLRHYRWVRGLI